MKKIITIIFVISMLSLMIPVQAEPITEISVLDSWVYTISSEEYIYEVVEKIDIRQDDGTWVEINKIESNETFVWENILSNFIDDRGQNITIYTNNIILDNNNNIRHHSSRGNFLVKAHQEGTYNAIIDVDGVENLMEGIVVFDMFYHDFDLQEPIVTGNPQYVNQTTNIFYTIDNMFQNMTMSILTTYRIDGSDAYEGVYNDSVIILRDVFIEPKYRWTKFSYNNITTDSRSYYYYREESIEGLSKETWSFSSEIGLPIEYTTEPTISLSVMGAMSEASKTYKLKDYDVDLSTWIPEEPTTTTTPTPTETETSVSSIIVFVLSLMMVTYIMFYIKKKRP